MKLPAQIPLSPFPIDALPERLRQVVSAIHELTGAPIPIIASSVLAALAMSTQLHYRLEHEDSRITRSSLFMFHIDDGGALKAEVIRRAFAGVQQAEKAINTRFKQQYEKKLKQWHQQNAAALASPVPAQAAQPAPPPKHTHVYTSVLGSELHQAIESRQQHAAIIDTEADHIFAWGNLAKLDPLCAGWDSRDLIDSAELTASKRIQQLKLDPPPVSPHSAINRYDSAVHWRDTRINAYLCVRSTALQSHLARHPGNASAHGFLERCLYTTDTATAQAPELTRNPGEEKWPDSHKALEVLSAFTTQTCAMALQQAPRIIKMPEKTSPAQLLIAQLGQELKSSGTAFNGLNAYLSQQPENAWRIALLFHCSEHSNTHGLLVGDNHVISDEYLHDAYKLVNWYLEVYLQLFAPPLQHPSVIQADTAKLEQWLAKKHIHQSTLEPTESETGLLKLPRVGILRSGPFRKDGALQRLNQALQKLRQQGKLKLCDATGKEMVYACADSATTLKSTWL